MQARFLLGPAGSGKTFRCLAEVRAALRDAPDGPPLILLAPKQATFQLERQLLAGPEISGYTRLHVLSFERLARLVLENLRVAPPKLLSAEGRVMVLRALLQRHANELKLFRRSARRAGFAQELSALLNEFQQHRLTSARLRALGQRDDCSAELRDKLNDLALLQEKYAAWLAAHALQDANRLLDLATEALCKKLSLQPSAFSLSGLWLDGFAEMTPQELDLLAAILPCSERATLAFCLDGAGANQSESSWLSIWSVVGKTFRQCRQRMENLPDCAVAMEILLRNSRQSRFAEDSPLRLLEENWSLPDPPQSAISNPQSPISVTACAQPEAEAVFAAREILKYVRAGNRFRDCAVLVRDLEQFHRPLARAFRRYEIPFFLDRRESVAHHPLAELTRGALRTVAFDWQHHDWFAALKAGFCAVADDKIDALENAALESGWRGPKWRAPLPDEKFERLRQILVPPFERFAARLAETNARPTGAQLAAALRELWGNLRVETTLETWSAAEIKQPAVGHRPSAIHATVFDQMNAWLDNLALAFPHEPLPLRDWLPVVEAGLAGLTVGVIPPVLDEVLIGAVDRARNPHLKFALVLGVNEGVFPAAPAPAAILTDADREELSQTVSLGPDLRERLAREQYYGYIACTRAAEKLAVTFSRRDADGKALNPSPFIGRLQNIFPGLKIAEFQSEIEPADAEHPGELAGMLAGNMACGDRSPLSGPALRRPVPESGQARTGQNPKWLEIPALKSLAESLAPLREPDKNETLAPRLAEKLYGRVLSTSVSRLEEFAQCPFKFFVRSGLRAEERKRFELDARERGSFQHEVLKSFHEQIMAEGKRWRDLTPAEARERIGQIAASALEHFRAGLLRDSAETLFTARTLATALQDFIEIIVGWMRRQYEFDPAAAELDFGGETSPATALEMALDGGRKLALQGRIDRVDLWRDGNRALAVVMDYKSGGKKLDERLVAHGIQMQLLAYLAALRRWKQPRATFGVDELIPVGAFYVSLRGRVEGGRTRDEVLGAADARQRAYRHHGRFDAGALDRLDSQRARDQFNYRLTDAGKLYANSVEALPRAEFEKLLDEVEARMREMGNAIFSGAASVNPYRKGAETACDFCDYRAACRIDPWTHQWRVLRAAKENAG